MHAVVPAIRAIDLPSRLLNLTQHNLLPVRSVYTDLQPQSALQLPPFFFFRNPTFGISEASGPRMWLLRLGL
jgi:hypothetical protein